MTCTTTVTPFVSYFHPNTARRSVFSHRALTLRRSVVACSRAVAGPTCTARSLLLAPSPSPVAVLHQYLAPRFGHAPRSPLPLVARIARRVEPRMVLMLAHAAVVGCLWCSCAASDPNGWNRPIQASPPLCCKCMFLVFQSLKSYVAVVFLWILQSRSEMLYMLRVF
jgi:hypothetical protein